MSKELHVVLGFLNQLFLKMGKYQMSPLQFVVASKKDCHGGNYVQVFNRDFNDYRFWL